MTCHLLSFLQLEAFVFHPIFSLCPFLQLSLNNLLGNCKWDFQTHLCYRQGLSSHSSWHKSVCIMLWQSESGLQSTPTPAIAQSVMLKQLKLKGFSTVSSVTAVWLSVLTLVDSGMPKSDCLLWLLMNLF